jgi:hypothetical protein
MASAPWHQSGYLAIGSAILPFETGRCACRIDIIRTSTADSGKSFCIGHRASRHACDGNEGTLLPFENCPKQNRILCTSKRSAQKVSSRKPDIANRFALFGEHGGSYKEIVGRKKLPNLSAAPTARILEKARQGNLRQMQPKGESASS